VRELDLGYARLGLERVARTGDPEALFAGLSNPASRWVNPTMAARRLSLGRPFRCRITLRCL